VVLVAILFGYFFAVGISTPIRSLAASTRAISRGEFHQRTPVRGATEISELAENFNLMASDIEEYIEKLKEAAEENRELFIRLHPHAGGRDRRKRTRTPEAIRAAWQSIRR